MLSAIDTKKRFVTIVLTIILTISALGLMINPQAQAGRNSAPDVDFDMTDSFNTSHVLNDGDQAMVFYRDLLKLIPDVNDPDGDDIDRYEWTFEVKETGSDLTTTEGTEIVDFTAGVDHLYQYVENYEPVMPPLNSDPVDYLITLEVWDEYDNRGEHTMNVTVYPFARETFVREVNMGGATLNASVSLVWRGLQEEAASSSDDVSPETPIFVYVRETICPDPNLTGNGGLGPAYDIRAVGCRLQDGSGGFIEAEITLPFLTSDLEEMGDSFQLQDDLRLEYYDEVEKRFVVIAGSHTEAEAGVKYVVGTVDHFSIYTAIVDSIYNEFNPRHYEVLPDLLLYRIDLSRSPALNGQEVEIRAGIMNTGITHARDVRVHFYDGEDLIGEQKIEIVHGGGEAITANILFTASVVDPELIYENHYITVFVNEQRTIDEGPGNYQNNAHDNLLMVISAENTPPTITITGPENGTVMNGTITINGTASDNITDLSTTNRIEQPFGNNDFAEHIYGVNGENPSVLSMDYYLLYENGTVVPGVHGLVRDIYGLNFDDSYTNVSFQDNDCDGKITPGDMFLIKNVINGGQANSGYAFKLNSSRVKRVEVSIDNGSWVPGNGTENWTNAWDSTTVGNGNISLMFRAYDGEAYSEVREIFLDVQNPVENKIPTIAIHSPANNTTVSGVATINGTTFDEDGTVKKVEISIDGREWIVLNATGPWNYEWNTGEVDNGEYKIRLRCHDGENYSEEVRITVTVDNKDDQGKEENNAGDDDGFLPGFEIIALAGSIGLTIILHHRKRNR